MIDYKQLEEGEPPNVQVITDDADAEMVRLGEMISACEFDIELPSERDDDGNFRFTIPGLMVSDWSETVYGIDGGKLDELTEQWNEEAIERAEAEQ